MKKLLKHLPQLGLLLLMVLPLMLASCGDDESESYHEVTAKDVVGRTFTQTVKLNDETLSNCEFTLSEVQGDATKLKLNVSGTDIPTDYDLKDVEVTAKQTGLGLQIAATYSVDKTVNGKKYTYSYVIAGACSNIGDGNLYFDLNITVDVQEVTA